MKKVFVVAFCVSTGMALGACNVLKPEANQPISFYSLHQSVDQSVRLQFQTDLPAANEYVLPTLIVNPPHASAGFETSKIIYLRQEQHIEYYAQSEWVASPARMLSARILDVLSRDGSFKAVVLTPTAALAELRLHTEIVRLQQEFFDKASPSRVRFTLRAHLMDEKTRRVLLFKEFDVVVNSTSENAAGGVAATNSAVDKVLKDLSAMTAKVAQAYRSR